MEILIAALFLGLIGSFHCMGMCGPIVINLPLAYNTKFQNIFGGLLYNLGRTFTYSIMGLLFGLLGMGLHVLGFQRWVSIIMGLVMVLSVIAPWVLKIFNNIKFNKFSDLLRKWLSYFFKLKSYKALFFIGILNGLLPCGLIYLALAGSVATANALQGMLYMLVFGLATLPMLLFISVMGNIISAQFRNKLNKLIPVVVVIVGCIFILRGLCLGIPYLSPPLEKLQIMPQQTECKKNAVEHACCKKTK